MPEESEGETDKAFVTPLMPNPGSDEAVMLGCKCPVLDNNHGKHPPWPGQGYWINGDCPVHNKLTK